MPAREWNSVRTNPGHRAVAVTPVPASAADRLSVNDVHHALTAEYVPIGPKPATELTLTTAPRPRATMPGHGRVAEDEHGGAHDVELAQLVGHVAADERRRAGRSRRC